MLRKAAKPQVIAILAELPGDRLSPTRSTHKMIRGSAFASAPYNESVMMGFLSGVIFLGESYRQGENP